MPHIPRPRWRNLAPLFIPAVLALYSCSESAKQEYSSDDYPDWVGSLVGEPAQADSSIGWAEEHSGPSAKAFTTTSTGQLSVQQLSSFLHLAWPQSSDALYDMLGNPRYTDPGVADYWTMPNGHDLTVYYKHGKATGYSLGDSSW
ncbi:MAG: hypothetical protein AAFN18_22765 [Cyanobacteria bacterium J06554_6]